MPPKLLAIGGWLRRRAENLLCLMLLTMFIVFTLQIIFRYALNLSIGWTHEVSVALWIWIVLFGSAFVVREVDEIRFDLIWSGASDRSRRVMQNNLRGSVDLPVRHLAAGSHRLRDFHEGGEHGLPEDPLRLSLLHLRDLRDFNDPSIYLAGYTGYPRQGARRF